MDTTNSSEATVFKHPETGRLLDIGEAPTEALMKGPFYFAIHKVWKHAIISAVLAILTVGISWLVYSVYSQRIMRNHLLATGWVAVAKETTDENSNLVILLVANIWAVVLMGLIVYVSLAFIFPESL